MRKYLSFFKMRFINGLQYRAAAIAGISTQFAWGFMNILAYSAFYKFNPDMFPMGFSQLSSYLWLQQSLLAMFMLYYFEHEILDSILSGGIAYELCRPTNIYTMWFVRNMANRLAKVVLRCVPIIVVAFLLPKPYSLSLPQNMQTFFVFIISLLIGFCLVVAYSMLLYLTAFYTISSSGIRFISVAAGEFLSGLVIPLPFLPSGIRKVFELLPFASMQNTPYLIYSGVLNGNAMVNAIILQVFWLFAFIALGLAITSHSLKRVVVQGG